MSASATSPSAPTQPGSAPAAPLRLGLGVAIALSFALLAAPIIALELLALGAAHASWLNDGPRRWTFDGAVLALAAGLSIATVRGQIKRRALRQTREHAARTDDLTGLSNREGFESRLSEWAALPRGDGQLVVMAIDIYRFGNINARFGTDAGDAVLRQLGARLTQLPDVGCVARVGADSFALVYTDVDLADVPQRMEQVLGLFGHGFRLGPQTPPRRLTAALGVALYPADSAQPAGLLGLAEAALFDRAWRQLGAVATELDPYGELAAEQLRWAQRFLGRRIATMREQFYEHLRLDPANRAVLDLLDDAQFASLARGQEKYLQRLLDPDLTSDWHAEHAARLGRIHALVGVPARNLVTAHSWYGELLDDLVQRIPGRLSQRQILLRTITRRLELDLTLQTEGAQKLQLELQTGLQHLAQRLRAAPRWTEVMDAMMDTLGSWPLMAFCAVYTLDAHGQYLLEAQSGGFDAFAAALAARGGEPSAQPTMLHCWANGDIESLARLPGVTPGEPALLEELRRCGVGSLAAVPLEDAHGRIQAVVMVYGRLPNQFDTAWMRDMLGNLRQSMSQVLQSIRAAMPVRISASDRSTWRRRLFNGGMRMHMQPIVALPAENCVKVEALVRLQLDDGSLLAPGTFLPMLSDQEIHRVFIEGLDQALGSVAAWDDEGLALDLSFNLPPVTLRHPDCMDWIRSALDRHGVAPRRLSFELLENEDIADQDAYTRSILDLHDLGVLLAMDDLGSGYSSLLRLRTLPFDMVKIDQGLVRAADRTPRRSVALVGALVRLAKGLDLKVAIEGLETAALVDAARVLGADLAQGYEIARPMPAEDIPRWVRERECRGEIAHPATRLGAIASHWLWEQGGGDDAHDDDHQHCGVGRYLDSVGLADSALAEAHAAMHRAARLGGMHAPPYLRAREAFYDAFATLNLDLDPDLARMPP